jgi:hypothetical protein
MKAKLQDACDRARKFHNDTKYSHVEYNECFESSLHDSYAARYFERLDVKAKNTRKRASQLKQPLSVTKSPRSFIGQ